ncbi:MAG: pectin acetylesterase-family hydrolase [Halioglobus sp.]
MAAHRTRLLYPSLICLSLTLGACSDGSDNRDNDNSPGNRPFQELYDQGIDRYLGVYTPMTSEVDGDTTVHTFGTGDGPLCQDESAYNMSTRDVGSQDLVIFLQGGGACWSELCLSTESATPGIPSAGILDPALDANPMKDWNVSYFNYCDGGLHASDRDWGPVGGDLNNRKQRGLHNLSAGLDVTARTFPQPRRIVLTGSSGGGFGTIFALPLVRKVYPDVPIDVLNDSGVGVSKDGQPEFTELLFNDWNMEAFIPASCGRDCYADGHLTGYFDWQLQQDPSHQQGMMSYKNDFVISVTFAGVGPEAFERDLLREMAELEALHPGRVASFIADGPDHTFLQFDIENLSAGGVTVVEWVESFLSGEGWETTID